MEGNVVDTITKQQGPQQTSKESTNILDDSSTWIALLLTLQHTLTIEPGVHLFMHPNSHHQIAYAKFNLQIHFSPSYTRAICRYKDANTKLIKRTIEKFDLHREHFEH